MAEQLGEMAGAAAKTSLRGDRALPPDRCYPHSCPTVQMVICCKLVLVVDADVVEKVDRALPPDRCYPHSCSTVQMLICYKLVPVVDAEVVEEVDMHPLCAPGVHSDILLHSLRAGRHGCRPQHPPSQLILGQVRSLDMDLAQLAYC